MPTGYTYGVCEGKVTDFAEFAMGCSRAFGALIHMRDDRNDAPIVEDKVSSYHDDRIDKAKAALAEFNSLSTDELRQRQKKEHADTDRYHREYEVKQAEENDRCRAMLEKVVAWNPPTSEHKGLKKFMVDQLELSKNRSHHHEMGPLQPFDEWRTEKLADLQRDVQRAETSLEEEKVRVAGRNLWVRQLRESLA